MKKALKIIGGSLLAIIILLLVSKAVADKRYFSDYDPNLPFKTEIAEAKEQTDEENHVTYQRIKFYFEARPGERVPTLMALPQKMEGKVPCIIFLHGIGQKKEFLDQICAPFTENGFAIACFDQYMQGERDVEGALNEAIAFRKRPWKTVNDTRRLIDYLQTHPDIDPERIYLVGASYGAITGSTVTAFDKRIKASILIYGGGHIPTMLRAPLIREELGDTTVNLLAPIVAYLLAPADPIRYAKDTSPTPVLFQNGSNDALVSPESAKRLQEAAGDPKEVTWYDSNHIGMLKEERHIVKEVLNDGLEWLLEKDKPYRKESDAARHAKTTVQEEVPTS